MPRKLLDDSLLDRAVALYEAGVEVAAIAARLGFGLSTIYQGLARRGFRVGRRDARTGQRRLTVVDLDARRARRGSPAAAS